jgi:diguanylate cyclase (GGDEF)-like protein
LDEALAGATSRFTRRGEAFSVVAIDLDHFKLVNDGPGGHEAGDRLLVLLAERLRAVLRPEDLLARIGGDEFCAVVAAAADATAIIAERMRLAANEVVDIDSHAIRVSASIGVATVGRGDAPDDVVRAADRAAYDAKHLGRNRVVVSSATRNRLGS